MLIQYGCSGDEVPLQIDSPYLTQSMYNKPYEVQIMIEQKHNLFPFSYDLEGSSSKNSFNQVKIRALKKLILAKSRLVSLL